MGILCLECKAGGGGLILTSHVMSCQIIWMFSLSERGAGGWGLSEVGRSSFTLDDRLLAVGCWLLEQYTDRI